MPRKRCCKVSEIWTISCDNSETVRDRMPVTSRPTGAPLAGLSCNASQLSHSLVVCISAILYLTMLNISKFSTNVLNFKLIHGCLFTLHVMALKLSINTEVQFSTWHSRAKQSSETDLFTIHYMTWHMASCELLRDRAENCWTLWTQMWLNEKQGPRSLIATMLYAWIEV